MALSSGLVYSGLTPEALNTSPQRGVSFLMMSLKAAGVDAILSFRAMLLDLLDKIEINQNYSKSDTLQVMRLLKNYDLLKDPQLDLLSGGVRRTRA